MRVLAVILALIWAVAAVAETPRHGLMWQRTGLPAVFPLRVRTLPGADYYLTLREAESGADALAAYIEGGRFFRVLVPPGRFEVRFAFGTDWRGEDTLFGADTEFLALEAPLSFGVQGLARKNGHLIDLRDRADSLEARVVPQVDCQGLRFEALAEAFTAARPVFPEREEETVDARLARTVRIDEIQEAEEAARLERAHRRFAPPRLAVRERLC